MNPPVMDKGFDFAPMLGYNTGDFRCDALNSSAAKHRQITEHEIDLVDEDEKEEEQEEFDLSLVIESEINKMFSIAHSIITAVLSGNIKDAAFQLEERLDTEFDDSLSRRLEDQILDEEEIIKAHKNLADRFSRFMLILILTLDEDEANENRHRVTS